VPLITLRTCRVGLSEVDLTAPHLQCLRACQNALQDRRPILGFIRYAMKPEQYARDAGRYEPMRANLNRALAFAGLAVEENGTLIAIDQVQTLTEARRRADELRVDLELRRVHTDVLRFCKEELLRDNYFHAVLEATKSVGDKLPKQNWVDGRWRYPN
jgi:hypothetical protein